MNKNILAFALLLSAAACTPKAGQQASSATPKKDAVERKNVTVYVTADSTRLRLTQTEKLSFAPFGQPFETQPCVFVDPGQQFQTFLGIGGALTDASAETFAKLPAARQTELLQAYFDAEKGIGYTLGRTNINSCDFSSDMYTYVQDGDRDLKTFNIAHDERYKIPFIQKAMAAAGGKLNLFVSPWSPPAWMKDNNNMLQGRGGQGGHGCPGAVSAGATGWVTKKRGLPQRYRLTHTASHTLPSR